MVGLQCKIFDQLPGTCECEHTSEQFNGQILHILSEELESYLESSLKSQTSF